jgi:hypothetical protein
MMEIDSFDMTSSSASLSRGQRRHLCHYLYKREIPEKCATSPIYFFLVENRTDVDLRAWLLERPHFADAWSHYEKPTEAPPFFDLYVHAQ